MKDIIVRAAPANWYQGVDYSIRKRANGALFAASEFRWEVVEEGAECPRTFGLNMVGSQILMDDLWNAGLRPTEGSGSAGSLSATQGHLEDMRKIAFNQLGVEL